MESGEVHHEGVPDGIELRGDDRQHGDIDTVELIEASPGTALAQTGEDLTDGLENKVRKNDWEKLKMWLQTE